MESGGEVILRGGGRGDKDGDVLGNLNAGVSAHTSPLYFEEHDASMAAVKRGGQKIERITRTWKRHTVSKSWFLAMM